MKGLQRKTNSRPLWLPKLDTSRTQPLAGHWTHEYQSNVHGRPRLRGGKFNTSALSKIYE